jgi:hypothetical protein
MTDEMFPIDGSRQPADDPRTPFCILGDMEEPLLRLADLGEAVVMMASDLEPPQSGAFTAVARSIVDLAEELKGERTEAWHALHPRRAELDQEAEHDAD